MKLPKNLYSRLTLITCAILMTGYMLVYAAYTTILDTEIASNAPLTSGLMTKIRDNIADLNTRVNFLTSGGVAGFYAHGSTQSIPNITSTTVINPTVDWDKTGNSYNATTGTFTAPVAGVYNCNCETDFDALGGTAAAPVDLLLGFITSGAAGSVPSIAQRFPCSWGICAISASQNILLSSGGTVKCNVYQSSGSARSLGAVDRNNFSCYRMGN